MSDDRVPRIRVDSYQEWIKKEGVLVHEDYAIDTFTTETKPWARYGMKGAAISPACSCSSWRPAAHRRRSITSTSK